MAALPSRDAAANTFQKWPAKPPPGLAGWWSNDRSVLVLSVRVPDSADHRRRRRRPLRSCRKAFGHRRGWPNGDVAYLHRRVRGATVAGFLLFATAAVRSTFAADGSGEVGPTRVRTQSGATFSAVVSRPATMTGRDDDWPRRGPAGCRGRCGGRCGGRCRVRSRPMLVLGVVPSPRLMDDHAHGRTRLRAAA